MYINTKNNTYYFECYTKDNSDQIDAEKWDLCISNWNKKLPTIPSPKQSKEDREKEWDRQRIEEEYKDIAARFSNLDLD